MVVVTKHNDVAQSELSKAAGRCVFMFVLYGYSEFGTTKTCHKNQYGQEIPKDVSGFDLDMLDTKTRFHRFCGR